MSAHRRRAAALSVMTVMLMAGVAGARADTGRGDAAAGGMPAAQGEATTTSTTTTVPAVTTTSTTTTTLAGPLLPGPLTMTVRANGVSAGAAPGPDVVPAMLVEWTYDLTNAGSVDLWALYLWHDGVGRADCPDRSLAPGETVGCTAPSTATAGVYSAAVRAWAWDDAGAEVAAEAAAHYRGALPAVVPAPAIDLETFAAGKDADAPPGPVAGPGQSITFRYVVRNTGNVPLWGLWIDDGVLGAIACPTRTLAPGERVVCATTRPVELGLYAAAAEARAWDAAGTEVADQDRHHYVGANPQPAVDIEALVEGFDGDTPPGPRVRQPGETILFTYLVTNTGGARLRGVRVRDAALGAVSCPGRTLAPGESMTCHAHIVGQVGEFASAGRVTARFGGAVVTDADPIYYHVRREPRIHNLAVEVTVDGRDADRAASAPRLPVGAPARFVYVITYTGNNIVYGVTIHDPRIPESLISCRGDRRLDAGETLRCTVTVPAVAGPYASLVNVVSWDADGRRVTADDWVHYYGMA